MIDTTNIELYKRTANWNGILKTCHCTTSSISDEILSSYDKQLLLDVAIAYSQLSNMRRIKDAKTHKTIGYNEKEADDCFVCANTIYDKVLVKDQRNTIALQSKAYNYYKYILYYFGVNRKEINSMQHIDIADCYKQINLLYKQLLTVPKLSSCSQIKARYRRGKAWSELIFKGFDNIAQKIILSLTMPRYKIRLHAIVDFTFVIDEYQKLTENEQKSVYSLYIKSLYNLGKLYSTTVYDNAMQIIPNTGNKTILQIFAENSADKKLSEYRFSCKIESLSQSEMYFKNILEEYKIEPFKKIDMQTLVKNSKDSPISPKDVFYQMGNLYNKWYRIFAISNKRRDIALAKGYSGIYFYFTALQYCLWCKKLHIPHAHFEYVPKYMGMLTTIMGIKNDDKHIVHMHSLFKEILK